VLVSTSPVDAAVHDAFGRVNNICSYDGYGREYMEHDLSYYLGDGFRGKFISDYIRPHYSDDIPAFHLVGALDKLTRDEVDASDPRDGLPVSLDEWIERDGVFCLKVKLSGVDVDWDVERTKAVAEVAAETLKRMGRGRFHLSVDSNEMNENQDVTLEYLRKLKKASPLAFDSLLYLEQPTERDLGHHMFSMRKVAEVKPVLADEGVTDLESFELALRLGWSGVALKACKWHSSSLLYVSKMEHYGIPYSIQDLTCPGLALVHSASLAARTNPVKGFEYNARQYLPFAYKEIQQKHRSLFQVKDGKVKTKSLKPIGLGFSIEGIRF
jgi:L-alanine-DL-glutamate epimerase-like enolase superfamily enzyme